MVQAVAALVLLGLAATASARTLQAAGPTDADILNFAYAFLLSRLSPFSPVLNRQGGACML